MEQIADEMILQVFQSAGFAFEGNSVDVRARRSTPLKREQMLDGDDVRPRARMRKLFLNGLNVLFEARNMRINPGPVWS